MRQYTMAGNLVETNGTAYCFLKCKLLSKGSMKILWCQIFVNICNVLLAKEGKHA